MSAPATQSKAAPVRPVGNPAEGEALMRHMMDVMDALLATIEEETALVRVGKLADAAKPIEARKTELSGLYLAEAREVQGKPSLSRSRHAGSWRRSFATVTTFFVPYCR